MTPIYLSGQWDLSAAGWVSLALFSRIAVLAEPTAAGAVATAADRGERRRGDDSGGAS